MDYREGVVVGKFMIYKYSDNVIEIFDDSGVPLTVTSNPDCWGVSASGAISANGVRV